MRFIVATYGSKHAGMLLAHLQSISQSHPEAKVSVYWQDVPDPLMGALQTTFPKVEFVRTDFDFTGNSINRIASKVLCWSQAVEDHKAEPFLVLADADTLVRRNLEPVFTANQADVIFTEKPAEPSPLNTGVMFVRGGAHTSAFFQAWRTKTFEVLNSPELLGQASDPGLPYAAPDQMSFYQLLGYKRGRREYNVEIGGHDIRAAAEPCERLNETNSRPLNNDIRIIHYKGGWQRILLDGRPFSRFRPRATSWPMLVFFLETFTSALGRVNSAPGANFTPADFGICWPWYFFNGKFNGPRYFAWRLKEAAKRAWLLITGKLQDGQ